ncbi:hypothetical protein R1sor_014243 [Riccia sorocarpa]|uniref:FAD/NAD(P)-binding domain-containing protein n=1 Tax=Riccia sorocarpa TaxID=122646 RepID=A0ABD3HEZ3_9MARC
MAELKRVVVIGGGMAGSQVAKGLEDHAEVTLIDPKNFFDIPYARLRAIVEPAIAERSLVLHSEYLKKAKIVESCAESATATEVVTSSGEHIPYDYLVICTGTLFQSPPEKTTKLERIEEMKGQNRTLLEAESVLIIGGGPVGVELAGEILNDFPEKKVTIVCSADRLIEFLGPKASRKCEKWLRKKGVTVILKDKIDVNDNLAPPNYETHKHEELKADAHFIATGKKLPTKWLETSEVLKDHVAVDGRLKMEASGTCQVEGLHNVFAAGDITDFKEIKQGYLAGRHAAIVVENIKKLIASPDNAKLLVYKPTNTPMGIVSLGRVLAVAQMPFGTILGRLAGLLKSKDLFIGKTRESLGLRAR